LSKGAKLIIGAGGTILVLCIGLFFFLKYLVVKSFPEVEGVQTLGGLHHPVEIFRDEYGVPHIYAKDEHDLVKAAGYVHAQDRLFQMELARRAGEGRLSELFDTATIKYDKLFRTLGLSILAESLEQHLHPLSRQLLENYAEGVNAFIEAHKGKYPIEFDMLNIQPEPWTVRHSIIISRLMAWELNFAWWVELTYAEIAERVSVEKFQEIIPRSPASVMPLVPREEIKFPLLTVRSFLNDVYEYREFIGLGPFTAGSNAWVVGAEKSVSGKPLLANDPHLIISLPSKWYEMHLSAPRVNVAGVSIPGAPFIIIGHNDSLAWGFTNAMLDDADFFMEQIDSTGKFYRFKDKLLPLTIREEKIYIGKRDSVEISVRSTHHGPLVNEVHPRGVHQHTDITLQHTFFSLRWTGFELSDEFLAFYKINRAQNRQEFLEGLKDFTVPAQCAVYADVRGNYCLWLAGRVPIRAKGNPLLPRAGWTGTEEWKEFIPFDKLPRRINPKEGFIISANQVIADESYPYYLSAYWEPPARSERIRELLQSSEKFSAHDFQQMQQDVFSSYARALAAMILAEYAHDSSLTNEIGRSLEYLRNWDYRSTQYDIATTIVHTFFLRLLHHIYEDEMGEDIFRDFVYFSAIPYRVTEQLMQSDSSAWFDDIRTEQREVRSDMIRRSFSEAIQILSQQLGDDMKHWQWGQVHTVTFEHPFGKIKPLDRIFNVGPFPLGGCGTSINKAEFKFTKPYAYYAGPSMRQVIDMAHSSTAYMVNPLGQSGQPLHDHYDDQTALWLNGSYRTVTTDWNAIRTAGWKRLELRP
jgi:penicillin amidase